jgi:DNA polymerase III delta prime subunit
MRSIARQSVRLANQQRLRAVSRPHSLFVQHSRTFHAGASRLSESIPPDGSPEHRRTLEEQREKERKAADEAVRQEYNAIDTGAEVRKGGRNRKATGSAKQSDVPKPPPLPDWFLEQNVLLIPEGASGNVEGGRQLRCVDAQTGHTLFHVPYYPEEAQEEKAKSDMEKAAKQEQDEHAKKASIPGINMNGQDFFQQKFGGQIPPVLEGDNELPLGFKMGHKSDPMSADPLSWTLIETEASARAAMGLSAQAGASSSHAATRSDIHLHCPDSNAHDQMDQYVRDIATVLHADLIRLDANDLADLTDEYVGGSSDSPGSFSTLGYDVYDGAAATGVSIRGGRSGENMDPDEFDEQEDEDEDVDPQSMDLGHFGNFDELRKALGDKRHDINKALGNFGIAGVSVALPGGGNPFAPPRPVPTHSKRSEPSEYITWDDARLSALLRSVLDAPSKARTARLGKPSETADAQPGFAASVQGEQGENSMPWPVRAGGMVGEIVEKMQSPVAGSGSSNTIPAVELKDDTPDQSRSANGKRKRTIVQIRDLKDILANRLGESIVKRLVRIVQRRRRDGEEVLVIGTTAADVDGPLDSLLDTYDDSPFRLIVVPPLFGMSATERHAYQSSALMPPLRSIYQAPSYDRIANINMRHITGMLNRLGHRSLRTSALEASFKKLTLPGTHILSEKVLPQEQVQRLVLTAIGLSQSHAKADAITPIHIALATAILARADHAVHSWTSFRDTQQFGKAAGKGIPFGKNGPGAGTSAAEQNPGQARIESIKKDCNAHETRLLAGVVDPQNIKTGFNDVHATPESIEALKSMTTLSLMRPDAFSYGVLASDRLTGLLLYGPPGTGKTLLAKAVAKESGATVLEVSGAQIYEKYVGEGEKMVRAVFSLAKKLSPCVVFIDEADAIFGSRGGSGNRNTHREIINQFLREWDGMDNNSVFMMVASNRPFDLDDAVLRRLPRRLLIDLPIAKDRESILGIHLRNELLDSSVNLTTLSEQTPLYSGSDLKNVCVSAAIAAVREENELVEKHKDDKDFKLPEKRTLTTAHFDKAIAEISASINEDMSSLTAIKKFDEQFGDRRGRKKKSGYGFGIGAEEVDENSARVRSGP